MPLSAGPRLSIVGAVAVGLLAACAGDSDERVEAAPVAPDTFAVAFRTSAGDFTVEFIRAWSPLAVDRVHRLVLDGFWRGARIYRVNERYAQFGYSGTPELDAVVIPDGLPDEPTRASNVRGSVSFARGGPGTRSAILFVNRSDNSDLDALAWNGVTGFPPVGRVVSGMETIDALYAGYGDAPMQWEDSIAAAGNLFLDRRYPLLDSIEGLRLREAGS